jgi:SET domain-containing protein
MYKKEKKRKKKERKKTVVCQHPETDKNYSAEYNADDGGVVKIDLTEGY